MFSTYLIIHSLKISLIVLVFIFFIVMLISFLLDHKIYLAMWAGGLGLFLINVILLISITYGNKNGFLILLQRISSTLGAFLMAEGCMQLIRKKINRNIIVFLCFNVATAIIYRLGLIPDTLASFIHFSFLISINIYAALQLLKYRESFLFNKYILSFIFLAWGLSYAVKCIVFTIKPGARLWGFGSTFLIILFFLIYTIFTLYRYKTNLLYEKEMCFDDTFNYSAIGMAVLEINGNVIRANQALSKILGYSSIELKNFKLEDISYKEDSEIRLKEMKELLLGRKNSFQLENRYIHKQENIIYTILNASLIRDRKDKPLYFILQIQDITSYKILQNELSKSNKKYEDLINSYDNSIAVFDKEYRYIVANQYVIDKINEHIGTSFAVNNIIGKRITEVYPNIDKTKMFKVFEEVMCSRIPKTSVEEFKNQKGEKYWYEVHVVPSPEGILVLSTNITDRVRDQQTVIEKEIKYRNLVEQSLDGIVIMNKEGYLIEFNHEMERITGMSKDQVLNRPLWDAYLELVPENFKTEDDYNHIEKIYKDRFMNNHIEYYTESYCCILQRKDGTFVNVENVFYTIATENTNMTCGICRDVTELKKLESIRQKAMESEKELKETLELDRLKTEFFANLSHEFRTPLNIILSSNKMLVDAINKQGEISKDYADKYLRASNQNCYRLLRLINNIIDITKFDSGFLHSNFQCWNIVSIVEEIAQSIVDYAKNKEIDMVFDTDVEEKYIMCDADNIERIMLNLLSNAIKFTHKGGIIEINVFDKNEFIEILVKDNGIGIPEDKLNLVFDRFRQVDKSLTREHEGSGIGLSLVKVLVEIHKGTIDVFSTEGKGTTFVIKLPKNKACKCDEVAATKQICDSKIEKVNVEFSDIYF